MNTNIYQTKNMYVFWGTAKTCTVSPHSPKFKDFCHDFTNKNNLKHVVFLKQTHSTQGQAITTQPTSNHSISLFENTGDYIHTNQKHIGLGVLTADCLPIVIHDPAKKALAVIHAGWRGTVLNIIKNVITDMHKHYNSRPQDFCVYFGPSAKACCYQVQEDFLAHIRSHKYKEKVLSSRKKALFFDNTGYNEFQLLSYGIKKSNINNSYNLCTICNKKFHSYRRDGQKALRQATIAWLQ